MLKWALLFFALALVAAFFGFGGAAAVLSRLLFAGFLALAAMALVSNALRSP